jgi:hypothetical protein
MKSWGNIVIFSFCIAGAAEPPSPSHAHSLGLPKEVCIFPHFLQFTEFTNIEWKF